MRITETNCNQHSSGTLLIAFEEMSQFESDDVEEEVQVIGLQSAVSRVLESRGFTYDEESNDWSIGMIGGGQ